MKTLRMLGLTLLLALAGAAHAAETYTGTPAKYVFFFIGDGMANAQRHAAEIYQASQTKTGNDPSELTSKILRMNKLPIQGMNTTHSKNSFITDSAAAGTALACGYKTDSGMISQLTDGTNVKSMATLAKEAGMKVGIISTVSIDHATPATFYANNESRSNYYEISLALADSGFDFFGGGGMKGASKTPAGGQDPYAYAESKGYTVVKTRSDFLNLEAGAGKVIVVNPVLDYSYAMPYDMDRTASEMSLTEITDKAITLLDNPNGFFLMVESGKIDWACHANDAAAAIRDTLEFDNAIAEALAFYEQHPTETLIVVTGDHECGGMTIGFAGTPGSGSGVGTGYATYMELLPKQTISYDAFTNTVLKAYKENDAALDAMNGYPKAIALLETYFGLKTTGDAETDRSVLTAMDLEDIVAGFVQTLNAPEDRSTERLYTKYGKSYYDPFTITLTHVLNRKSGISWTSYSHTGVPLMTNAQGAGQELFQGYYDNTDIAKKIMAAMGLSQ